MAVFLIVLLVACVLPSSLAITCQVEVESYARDLLDTDFPRTGHITMNGDIIVGFMNGFTTLDDSFSRLDTPGLWLAVFTPACDLYSLVLVVRDDDIGGPTVLGPNVIYSDNLDAYLEAVPDKYIIAGAMAAGTFPFMRKRCRDDLVPDDGSLCFNRRHRYFLAAYGLGVHYGSPSVPDHRYLVSFVVVKGCPNLARYNFEDEILSPLVLEAEVTTSDALACVPRAPIVGLSDGATYGDMCMFPLSQLLCNGLVSHVHLHAHSTGTITVKVFRSNGTSITDVESAQVQIVSTGESIVCINPPLPVEKEDWVGFCSSNLGSIVDVSMSDDAFDNEPWPNCEQSSGSGLSEAERMLYAIIAPGNPVNAANMQNAVLRPWFIAPPFAPALAAFHPIMNSDVKHMCSCTSDDNCTAADPLSMCIDDKCQCKDSVFDVHTMTCLSEYLAMDKTVLTSGVEDGSQGSFAVDDNPSTDPLDNTCTILKHSTKPYITIDLGQEQMVYGVTFRLPKCPREEFIAYDTGCGTDPSYTFIESNSDLSDVGWGDRISCIEVKGPGVWLAYSGTGFTGNKQRFSEATYEEPFEDLGTISDNNINSIRWTALFSLFLPDLGMYLAVNDTTILLSNTEEYFYFEDDYLTNFNSSLCVMADSSEDGIIVEHGPCVTTWELDGSNLKLTSTELGLAIADGDLYLSSNAGSWLVVEQNVKSQKECTSGMYERRIPNTPEHNHGPVYFTDDRLRFDEDFLHAPCVYRYNYDVDGVEYNTIINGITSDLVQLSFSSLEDWNDGGRDVQTILAQEASAVDMMFGVSDKCGSNCDPSTFQTCHYYKGYLPTERDVYVPCDKVLYGRYVTMFEPQRVYGDSPVVMDDVARQWFSVCDFKVHGLAGIPFGFPCSMNVTCTKLWPDGGFYCQDGKCICGSGLEENQQSGVCDDVNECELGVDKCTHNCTNTYGSYTCGCAAGYTLHEDGITCVDDDECNNRWTLCHQCNPFCFSQVPQNYQIDYESCSRAKPSLCQQNCTNYVGTYECSCFEGYELADDWHQCTDINECDTDNGGCEENCTNSVGSYECSCHEGYGLAEDMHACTDINECEPFNGGCDHSCNNTDGSYSCECYEGHRLHLDGHDCQDIDECQENSHDCNDATATCENIYGSYKCICNPGYDGEPCENIDECKLNIAYCEHKCVDTEGSYGCSCNEGYRSTNNHFSCEDIDECAEKSDDCGQTCINTAGGYICDCRAGYSLNKDGFYCDDIDECDEDSDNCMQNCNNNDGDFTCWCNTGYKLNEDGHSCNDIDECAVNFGQCLVATDVCENTDGSFVCMCKKGYERDDSSGSCTDHDECSSWNGGCEHGCTNNEGSYECSCTEGYRLLNNGLSCEDVDECAQDIDECEHDCQNTPGTYTCSCDDGHVLGADGYSCNDVDECGDGRHGCAGECVNTEGSYECRCSAGTRLLEDGTCQDICRDGERFNAASNKCEDIDECEEDPCPVYSSCVNLPRSYRCPCWEGYVSVGEKCRDANECSLGNGGCQYHCTNSQGSFQCGCPFYQTLDEGNQRCVGPYQYTWSIDLDAPWRGEYSDRHDPATVATMADIRSTLRPAFGNTDYTITRLLRRSSGQLTYTIGFNCSDDEDQNLEQLQDRLDAIQSSAFLLNGVPYRPLGAGTIAVTNVDESGNPQTHTVDMDGPCSFYDVVGFCQEGSCEVDQDDEAFCSCNAGWAGQKCDARASGLAPGAVIGIAIGGSIAGLLLLAGCASLCYYCLTPRAPPAVAPSVVSIGRDSIPVYRSSSLGYSDKGYLREQRYVEYDY